MGEINESEIVDGGYQEQSRFQLFAKWFNRDQTLENEEHLLTLGEINEAKMANCDVLLQKEVHHHDDDHHGDDHHGEDHGHALEPKH